MIIILTCIIMLATGIVMRKLGNKIASVDFSLASEGVGVILILFGIVGIVAIAISLPLIHSSIKSEILQFEEARATYEWARAKDVDMEIAAFQLNIAEYNRWLTNQQYWKNTIVGLFIPDKVMELKPIK
ncbi:hypothetical protein FJZ31_39265 [Candidatus Poribacteria bacterium]|nr:hypothetical protein [Candidatus Poribacteria bacterium]